MLGLLLVEASKLIQALIFCFLFQNQFHGMGTRFAPPTIDNFNVGASKHLACLIHDRPSKRALKLLWKGSIVAHKTLPCMTEIVLCNDRTKRCEHAIVADWGPVHADIDIYYVLSHRLGHNGMERVTWFVLGSLARKGKMMKVPVTPKGIAMYEKLKEVSNTNAAAKGIVKKANRIMLEFDNGYGDESIMISRAMILLKINDADD